MYFYYYTIKNNSAAGIRIAQAPVIHALMGSVNVDPMKHAQGQTIIIVRVGTVNAEPLPHVLQPRVTHFVGN